MADRATIRANSDPDLHFKLLDNDVDDVLAAVKEMRAHFDERMDRQDRRITAIVVTAVGCLVSLVGGLVLLAITLGTR